MPNPASVNLPNPQSYTDNGDGTVLDNVTGLVWQKAVTSSQAYVWDPAPPAGTTSAQSYCASLTLGGRTWHLPTRIELVSIIDFTHSPAVNATVFPGTPGGKYHWTSTPWVVSQIASKPQDSWMVNFSDGGLDSNGAARTNAEYARCVSSPAVTPLPNPHYVRTGAGEVQDVSTKLIWVQASNATAVAQAAASSYCAGLGLNGHTWRLPSVNELGTLVDDNPDMSKVSVSPAIDQCVFSDTPVSQYYMSSSSINGAAWALNYLDGFTSHSQASGFVRCVR